MNAPVTPARAALDDLIATMQAVQGLYEKVAGRDPTDTEDRQISVLENRRNALEKQLQQIVQDQLGIDYAQLWHAVTPS